MSLFGFGINERIDPVYVLTRGPFPSVCVGLRHTLFLWNFVSAVIHTATEERR